MIIRFGPSGIGGKKEAIDILNEYHKNGISASEISFTYGVYLDRESAIEIGNVAKKLNIKLSIHAPYFVNLNSVDKLKIESSKKRILDCCEIGNHLSNENEKTPIVFHAGFYSNKTKEETFENIKKEILELNKIIKDKKWNVILCPEIMGKINVFGSIKEISKLVKEAGCGFCIDFAHILARYDNNSFEEIEKNFNEFDEWHCHFSGILYGDKGEKSHKQTEDIEWKNLLGFLSKFKNKKITIISEAPIPEKDSINAISIYKNMSK